MTEHTIGKKFPIVTLLLVLFCSIIEAQVDDFNEEEADYFRNQKIVPLIDREQDGDYGRSTYLIPHDITIPRGKTLTLYPGCTLLFKKDTRLIVKGSIIAKGKERNPVLFCKLENSDYYTPLDSLIDTKWDGIFVKDSGRIELQYTHITNSKYGIVHEGPHGDIILDSVQFYENRYHNLKVAQKKITVTPYSNMFFQANGNLVPPPRYVEFPDSEKVKPVLSIAEKPQTPESVRRFRAVMWTGIVAGGLVGVSGHFIHMKYKEKYDDDNEFPSVDKLDESTTSTGDLINKATRYRTISKIGEGMRIGGAGLAGLSVIGLTISLAF